MKSVIDFIKTERSKGELRSALEVLREFKVAHSFVEDLLPLSLAWAKLELLEEYLAHLVDGESLREDTLQYIAYIEAKRGTEADV